MVTRICLLYYATLGSKTMDLELSVWDEMCIFVLLSWRFFSFSRFSSRLPGKCVIESGFMLLALIILFYALLFSYSGCKRKLWSFIGELIGVHFCVDMYKSPPFFPPHPSRAFLRHLAPFQHTHRGRMCQKARLLNLCAPTEQTTTRGKIDSLWQCCWNHCGQTDCRVTVSSPLLSSPQTEHRLKATIWQLDMPRQHCTHLKQSFTSVFTTTWLFFCRYLLSWWFKSHLTDTDAFPYPFLCVFVLLQKASATWQWTPIRLQCRCQTPTPGRQLWITWGCLPWE